MLLDDPYVFPIFNLQVSIKMSNWKQENFVISTDKEKLDIDVIYTFLSNSYWASTRSLEQIVESIKNSFCFAVYDINKQVGFARVVTDYSTFAYLADVFILHSHQGRGLGKRLIDAIFITQELKKIDTWILLTNDAQKLYHRTGFIEYPYPERVMIKKLT